MERMIQVKRAHISQVHNPKPPEITLLLHYPNIDAIPLMSVYLLAHSLRPPPSFKLDSDDSETSRDPSSDTILTARFSNNYPAHLLSCPNTLNPRIFYKTEQG